MLYLVESRQTDTSTHILEFHRNKDGSSSINVIKDFKPYFFVDEDAPVEKLDGVVSTEKGYISIENTKLKKVITQKSILVRPIRAKVAEMGFKYWEADILFHNRYTIDLPNDIENGDLKVCWIDIETDMVDSSPNLELADQKICCLSTKIDNNMVTWLCGPNNYPGTRYFQKEEDMLEDFLSYFYKESPDVISAWNLDGFDLPYLIKRCTRIGVDCKRLSKTNYLKKRDYMGKTYYKLYGTVQLDLLDAYRLWRKFGNLPQLQSYSLDYVARSVLDERKLFHGKPIGWLWRNDLKTLIEYNRHDVELLDKIDKRCQVIRFFDELRRKCRIQFEDVYKTTAMIDGFLLNRLNKKVILPTAKHIEGDKFAGAYVFDPVPGLYKYVLCEDIASMYPSIIQNFNISYETVGGGEIILPLTPKVSFSKKTGIIPMFLDELRKERDGYKKLRREAKTDAEYELWDQRQFATKILMNAFFGYLGYTNSRLYKKPVASAITGMGKYILLKIADIVKELGAKVIYGDTDSVYITSTKDKPYEVVMEGVEIMKYVNESLEKMSIEMAGRNLIEIEFEKALDSILFTDAKKRYAYKLLWESDKKFNVDEDIHIQGFDSIRSDSNEVSKISQKKVIEMVIEGKEKKDVVAYLRILDKKMRSGEFKDEEFGFPRGITKHLHQYNPPSPVIKGAHFSNINFKTNFGKGSKPKWVYIKTYNGMQKQIDLNNKTYILESIAFEREIPKGFTIDWNKMSDNTFHKKLTKIFNAVGWEWEDLSIRGLNSFMG